MYMKTNSEGLTWREWYMTATNYGSPVYPDSGKPISVGVLHREWEEGTDPTDFAAHTIPESSSSSSYEEGKRAYRQWRESSKASERARKTREGRYVIAFYNICHSPPGTWEYAEWERGWADAATEEAEANES